MATLTFQVRTYHRLPIHAPLYFHNEDLQGTGALWNVSLDGCRMDANVPLRVGDIVELMLLLGPRGAVYVKAATVCWTRGHECGLRLILVQPGGAAHLERYITQRLTEAAHAQYLSR
jgi:hypothetical protein